MIEEGSPWRGVEWVPGSVNKPRATVRLAGLTGAEGTNNKPTGMLLINWRREINGFGTCLFRYGSVRLPKTRSQTMQGQVNLFPGRHSEWVG